ncbi:hypothetical protein H0H93_015355, partial [Arthromyces matolae]
TIVLAAASDGEPHGAVLTAFPANWEDNDEEILQFHHADSCQPDSVVEDLGRSSTSIPGPITVHIPDNRIRVFPNGLLTGDIPSIANTIDDHRIYAYTPEGMRSVIERHLKDIRTLSRFEISVIFPSVADTRVLLHREKTRLLPDRIYVLDFDQSLLASLIEKDPSERTAWNAQLVKDRARVKVVTRRFMSTFDGEPFDLEYPYRGPKHSPPGWLDYVDSKYDSDEEDEEHQVLPPGVEYDEAPEEHRDPIPFGYVQTTLQIDGVGSLNSLAMSRHAVLDIPHLGAQIEHLRAKMSHVCDLCDFTRLCLHFRHLSSSMSTLASASTPVRAITTTLLTRSTPSIPPPTQKYEPIVKSILKTRLIKKAFLYSAIFSWTYVVNCVVELGDDGFACDCSGLTIFVKSKKHPLYLNGTFLFVLLSQLSVALVFSLRNVTLDRYVFRWSREETSTRRFNVTHILQSFIVAALLASLALPIAGFAFFLIRTTTLPLLYKLPILHNFLRPFTAHFLRGPWTIFLPFRHISLLIRTWFLAFTTLVTWEFSNTVFETFIYNPLSVIGSTPEPHVTLISGISSTDLGFRYMAYQDIRKFSSSETETAANQRSALFNDQKYNPSLWSHLVRESLVFLGKDYQHLLRRGKPAPPAPVKPVLPAAPATPSRLNTPTPLIRTSIFKSAKQASPIRNVVESLGSDGPLAQALNAGAEAARKCGVDFG